MQHRQSEVDVRLHCIRPVDHTDGDLAVRRLRRIDQHFRSCFPVAEGLLDRGPGSIGVEHARDIDVRSLRAEVVLVESASVFERVTVELLRGRE